MRQLFKRVFLFLLILFWFWFPSRVFADDNFAVGYNLFYRFLDSGNTQVTQTTTLTNKKTNLYASEYEIVIFGKVVGGITGFDGNGNLALTATKEDADRTKIHLSFNQKAVGVGNSLSFSISYELAGLVSSIGRIKEIIIPKTGNDPSLTAYSVRVSVPRIYGAVAYVKPLTKFDETQSSYIFSFDRNQAQNGVLIGFGDVSHFQFKLVYHLKNNSFIQRRTEIAIPPDTSYQQVIYNQITPKPVDVTIDKDGNFLASFDLAPKQTIEVIATGSALIYTSKRNDFSEKPPVEVDLSANKYWEVTSPEITDIAKDLKDAFSIYKYVSTALKYNYSRVNIENQRLGAKAAFNNPNNAICMEFTDSFIALARSRGIPAREINGYAYTSDEYLKPLSLVADVLHAWPEYWDEFSKSWIPVDPTWANTTGGLDYFNSLDFNHFVFVRRGVSSTYPPAAGSYRQETTGKDVEITLKTDLPVVNIPSLEYNIEIPKKIIAGGKQKILINIYNNGGIARYNLPVNVSGDGFGVKLSQSQVDLAPFGKSTIEGEITEERKQFWGKVPLIVSVGDQVKNLTIDVQPMELLYLPIYLSIFSLFLIVTFIFVKKHVFKKKT